MILLSIRTNERVAQGLEGERNLANQPTSEDISKVGNLMRDVMLEREESLRVGD